ncbi:MAG: hypothetical protein ACRC7S_18740 [Cetobacterium sp.]
MIALGKDIFASIPILNCLVSKSRETDLEGVNQVLKDTDIYGGNTSGLPCYFCGKDGYARIIPKPGVPTSAQIQDKGYICKNCLSMGYLDKNQYGIRELK